MKKRLLSLAMAVAMMFGSAAMLPEGVFRESTSITASADVHIKECGDWEYYYYDDDINNIGIMRYNGSSSHITIPSSLDGKRVTRLSETFRSSTYDNSNIVSVTIPNTVTRIESNTFSCCNNLNYVSIPNSVLLIGEDVFGGCTSLRSIEIPDSVVTIDEGAFLGCTNLESITMGSGVTLIGSNAFRECTSLRSITIPNNVTSLGSSAFSYSGITSISIPESVTTIGDWAFYGCSQLEEIKLPKGLKRIEINTFQKCEKLKKIDIPDGVHNLDLCTFNNCTNLKEVKIPKSTWIADHFPSDCPNIVLLIYKDSPADQLVKMWSYYGNTIKYKYIDDQVAIEDMDDFQFYGTYINEPVSIEFLYNGIEHEYKYSDNYILKKANTDEPDEKVAKMLSRLAIAAYDKNQIVKCLSNMGFYRKNIKDYDSYSFMPTLDDNDRVAYSIAYKKIEGKNIFFIPIRGTHGNLEWISDFNLGTGDTHEGFYKAANIVKSSLMSEMKTRNVDSNNTILIFTGHSRGAAVANILAGEFSTSAMTLDGYSVDVPSDQIFAYTYACPAVAKEYLVDRSLNNIHNFNNPSDLIPALPLKSWGYARYGQTHEYRFDQEQAYAFTHYFYEMLGEDYKGYKDNSSLVSAIKLIANSKDSFNSRPNQFLFKRLALFMTDDDSEHLPCSKNKLEEDINNQYPDVSWYDLLESVSETFVYILLKQDVGVTTVLDAITHGHMGESYICLTDALFINNTFQGHSFIDSKTPAVLATLGYKMQKCSICGKEIVVNYKPDSIENVVKNVEKDLNLTFHRCDEDDKTYGLFKSVEVDGKTVDPSNYSTKSGSLKLTLDKSFVSKLSAGTHSVKVLFEDGFSETNIFVAENANEPTVDRLAGKGRYETATKISSKAYGFETASTVVLAYGLNYADALAGVSLAKAMNAPILLTNLKTLPNETLVEIKRLGASNVIILGGTGAVGEEVEKILKENNLNVERIAGKTRFETATKIAQKMQKLNDNKAPKEVFFVYAFNSADALSVSAVAAVKGAPVIYLKTNGELDDATANYLKSVKGSVKNAYVIGGSGVISDDMMKKAGKALGVTPTRVFGKDRFATCVAVNEKFADVLDGDSICVATGMDFPDALAGGVYAAINKAPLFLVNGKLKTPKLTDEQKAYLKAKSAAKITAFGGVGVVPDSHIADIAKNSV